jgi:hypothetical protein
MLKPAAIDCEQAVHAMRRNPVSFFLAIFLATACCGSASAATHTGGIAPVRLQIDHLGNPIGLDDLQPRFQWNLRATNPEWRGLRQSAYRIMVTASVQLLIKNQGDLWDSGRVESASLLGIVYQGRPLQSHTEYFWKIKVWDQDGQDSNWSEPAHWATALLHPEEWRARWIAAAPDTEQAPQARENVGTYVEATAPLPIFRRTFQVTKPIRKALVFVSGLGQYELHLNGGEITQSVLNPGWTNYRKTVLYDAYDLTAAMRPGVNSFSVLLGNGMYNVPGVKGRYTKFIGSFGQPKLILQMHITYTDGSEEALVSDKSWKTVPGPITFTSIYGGEDFDARKEPAGWEKPGFDDRTWESAIEVAGPNGNPVPGSELIASRLPRIAVDRILKAERITHPRNGVAVYDLGQNFSGWPILHVRGETGDAVTLIPGELLDDTGLVSQASGGAGPENQNRFTYTLRGDGTETWHPRFSYWGFRYVQVEVRPHNSSMGGRTQLDAVEGAFIHAGADTAGSFTTSQPKFAAIHRLIDNAILSNSMSVLSDCPTREKLGWLEQTHLAAASILYNFDDAALYEKMAADMRDAQLANGLVPAIAPEYVAFVNAAGISTNFRDSPEWGSAIILSPWAAYQFYGDKEPLESSYDAMRRYAEYLKSRAHDHILSYGLGDWFDIGPGRLGESQLTGKSLTATALYYQDLLALTQISRLLGKQIDSAAFAAEASATREAFNRLLFHADTQQYDRGSQTANAIPLALGMVPEASRQAVLEHLVEDIRAHNNHVTAGDIGFHYVVRALTDSGRSDVLRDMLLRNDPPSYGFQLAKGATSLTEDWNSSPMSSQNHFMLGHAEEWFYHGLAGIDFDMSRPTQEQITIRPAFLSGIGEASARYQSVLGLVESGWRQVAGGYQIQLTIPPGACATVLLPATASQILESEKPLDAEWIKPSTDAEPSTRLLLGSGVYRFQITVPQNERN